MKKKSLISFVLIGIVILLTVFPLILLKKSNFSGSDNQGQNLILELDPEYEPWITPVWTPPGPAIESLLFSLQAAAGSAVLFYGIGYFVGKKSRKK